MFPYRIEQRCQRSDSHLNEVGWKHVCQQQIRQMHHENGESLTTYIKCMNAVQRSLKQAEFHKPMSVTGARLLRVYASAVQNAKQEVYRFGLLAQFYVVHEFWLDLRCTGCKHLHKLTISHISAPTPIVTFMRVLCMHNLWSVWVHSL